jgi:predicted Zn-dependent protease
LVYLSKNNPKDGIAQLEKALDKAPWHKEWRENLTKAYRQEGDEIKALALEEKYKRNRHDDGPSSGVDAAHDDVTGSH